MYISGYIQSDLANGLGIRLSVFVSGCTNHCDGCFQPETWDFHYGKEYDEFKDETFIMSELSKSQYKGITFLGGDPFEEINQCGILPLIRRIKEELPDKDIWVFTGFIYDKDLVPGGKRYYSITDELLNMIDVIVDGPFIKDQRDITLKFRGSKNQRIIDLKKTREGGSVVLLDL